MEQKKRIFPGHGLALLSVVCELDVAVQATVTVFLFLAPGFDSAKDHKHLARAPR